MTSTLPAEIGGAHLQRVYSRDPEAFPEPNSHQEQWRFAALRRLRPLFSRRPADGEVRVEVAAPAGVQVDRVPVSDPVVGSVLTPWDRVSALALAAVTEAVVIRVPRESDLDEPVHVTVTGSPGHAFTHLVVEVDRFARAVVIVDHVGSTTLASNVEIRLDDGAELTFVSLQDWADDATHVEAQAVQVGRDARLRHAVVTLGGETVRISPSIRYAGPGGDATLLGLYFADQGQHFDHRLLIEHTTAHCRSLVTYKGALAGDEARTVWVGDVLISPEGIGTDSYELNRNLILSDGARAESVPNLEIETGDVIGAGHASATGRFDDEQLFYLQARGIPADEARRMVVRAFFAEIVEAIGVPLLRERLTAAIEAELAGAFAPAVTEES